MPNYSGRWTLAEQLQGVAAGTWTGVPFLYTWGSGTAGRLGTNSTVARSSPTQVGTDSTWSKVSAGYTNNTVAIKLNGTLWTWGENNTGQLGQNDRILRSSPVQVGALTNWSNAWFGNSAVLAVKTDGTLWAWGSNSQGRLGLNDVVSRSSPTQVGALTDWSLIAAEQDSGFFAVKTDGTMWSWGNNDSGQLGHNDRVYRSSPTQVGALTNWAYMSGFPDSFQVAIKTDGSLWSWGRNTYGGLGLNDVVTRSSPVQVGVLTNWSKVSCSSDTTTLTKTDGTLWGFGRNNTGQIGRNNVINPSSPVQVGALTDWLTPGAGNVSVLCLKTDGTLWGWGGNSAGLLGDGTTIARSSPVQIGSGQWPTISTSINAGGVGIKRSQ